MNVYFLAFMEWVLKVLTQLIVEFMAALSMIRFLNYLRRNMEGNI